MEDKRPWKVDDPLRGSQSAPAAHTAASGQQSGLQPDTLMRGKSAPAKPPCQKCPKRYPACHDKCEEYLAFRERRLEDYKRRAQAVDMANYTQDRVTKAKRRAGKKP